MLYPESGLFLNCLILLLSFLYLRSINAEKFVLNVSITLFLYDTDTLLNKSNKNLGKGFTLNTPQFVQEVLPIYW